MLTYLFSCDTVYKSCADTIRDVVKIKKSLAPEAAGLKLPAASCGVCARCSVQGKYRLEGGHNG